MSVKTQVNALRRLARETVADGDEVQRMAGLIIETLAAIDEAESGLCYETHLRTLPPEIADAARRRDGLT